MLTLYCSQGLKVMGLRSKIGFYVRGEGLGSHKLSWCKCLLGCTYKGQKLTKTILQGWSTYAVRGIILGLVKAVVLAELY